MKHDRATTEDIEPHVFDQTNGMVDRGDEPARSAISGSADDRNRTAAGLAMLSVTRP